MVVLWRGAVRMVTELDAHRQIATWRLQSANANASVQLGPLALRHVQLATSSAAHGLARTPRIQTGGARTADCSRVAGRALALTGRVEYLGSLNTLGLALAAPEPPIRWVPGWQLTAC
jgi:hypothetical protein